MAVFRVNKDRNYTVMSNYHLRDKTLSLKAKGLLSVILSLPDEWDFSKRGLLSLTGETEYSLDKVLDELKEHAYLSIEKVNPQGGKQRITWEYRVYESPDQNPSPTPPKKQEKQETSADEKAVSQYPENQGIETQCIEKPGINKIHTQSNTEELNTKGVTSVKRGRFTPPTLEEVKAFREERNSCVDAERFFNYYTSIGWMVAGKKLMKDWKAAFRYWENGDAERAQRPNGPFKQRKPMDERKLTESDYEAGYYADIMNRPRQSAAV